MDELRNPTLMVTPIRAVDVDRMSCYIDRALGYLHDAATHLEEARRCTKLARDSVARPPENIENLGEVLGNIREMLGKAVGRIVEARGEISDVGEQFDQLLEFVASSAPNNLMMSILYRGLASRALRPDYPSLKEELRWGVEGTLAKLSQLERLIAGTSAELGDEMGLLLDEFFEQVAASVDKLLSEPIPLRWVPFTTYENNPPLPFETRAPVYIDDETDGTIGVLRIVLEGVKSSLETMERFSQKCEPMPLELREFKVDEELSLRLEENPPEFVIDREKFYEILPPAPIKSSPGLSVFHEFRIKQVSYHRVDLAGMCGSSEATPIPLWFIGITLWWGQWKTEIEQEPGATVEIFDFGNPVLPLAHGTDYVHKPLACRWKMPENVYGINVIVVSLKPFTISSS